MSLLSSSSFASTGFEPLQNKTSMFVPMFHLSFILLHAQKNFFVFFDSREHACFGLYHL